MPSGRMMLCVLAACAGRWTLPVKEGVSVGLKQLVAVDPITKTKPMKDARFKSAFVMAPLAVFFSAYAIDVPVAMMTAENDQILRQNENADRVRQAVRLALDEVVPNATHFVFLAPCPRGLDVPEICVDPNSVARNAVHRKVLRQAIAFFANRRA